MSDISPLLNSSENVSDEVLIQNGQNVQIEKQENTHGEKIKTTHIRWYILTVFCLLGFLQNLIWNTWGPIAASSELVFGWNDGTIALMTNWGPIAYVISAFFFSWLMDVKGLRISCITAALFMFAGAAIRCGAIIKHLATWLIHIGQLLNGLGGPVIGAAPPLLSVLWFPINERITATAISTCIGIIGTAVSFVLGPYIVAGVNTTACTNETSLTNHTHNCQAEINHIYSKIMLLMYIHAGLSAIVLILTLVYFPSKPKYAPSVTASLKRTDFKKGVFDLLRNLKFWTLAIPYGTTFGVFACWSSILDVNLKPMEITEETAGWIGFGSTMAGQVAAIGVGMFADLIRRRKKTAVIIRTLYTIALILFVIFTLARANILITKGAVVCLEVTAVLGSICLYALTPLMYELGCEATYPVAEGVTTMAMTFLLNLAALIFLLVMMIPHIGVIWTNWCLVAVIVCCIPVFIFTKIRYSRIDIDIVIEKEVKSNST